MNPLDEYKFLPFTVSPIALGECVRLARNILSDEPNLWTFSNDALNLAQIFNIAPPDGGAHLPKFVIWTPATGSGSVFASNLMDGWQLFARELSRLVEETFINVRVSNDLDLCRKAQALLKK